MNAPWGATPEDWAHFDLWLGLGERLLPVVSNPHAEISERSNMKALGKTPSRYNAQRKVAGIPKWTSKRSTPRERAKWMEESDYGACLILGYDESTDSSLVAIDCDKSEPAVVDRLFGLIGARFDSVPVRVRNGTSRCVFLFEVEGRAAKDILRESASDGGGGGAIEILAEGQQIVVAGTHPSLSRYGWRTLVHGRLVEGESGADPGDSLPPRILRISERCFAELKDAIACEFNGEWTSSGRPNDRKVGDDIDVADPVADYLRSAGLALDEGRGKIFVSCPWESDHTGDSGVTEAAWLLAGSRGEPGGNFRCQHAHCADRTTTDFEHECGFTASQFDALEDDPPALANTYSLADLAAWARTTPTPKAFVMEKFIPAGEPTLLTGPPGAAKTLFAVQLTAAHAAGRPMLGAAVSTGPALVVTVEDDERECHWRAVHTARALGLQIGELAGRLHIAVLRGRLNNELAVFDRHGSIRPTSAYQELRATIAATGAKLVVLDHVGHFFVGDENVRAQVTSFVNLLSAICQDLDITIVLIGHTNKAGASYSGSTAWLAAVRSQIIIDRPEDSVDPDERVLKLGKANYSRMGEELRFRWWNHALVRDVDLAIDVRDDLLAASNARHDDGLFLQLLDQRNEQRRAVSESKSSRTYAPRVFADMVEAKGVSAERFEAAMDRLYAARLIERGYLWRADRKPVEGVRRRADDVRGDVAPSAAPTCGD